jgi:heme exporter protein D
MNWSEFFAMGGYGLYVWGSYGFAAVILIVNSLAPLLHRRVVLKRLREYARIENQE